MTHPFRGRALLERAVTIHRFDCAAVAEPPAGAAAAGPDERGDDATGAGVTAAASYAVAARGVYDALRRQIGQASGLLILAVASGQRQVADLPEIGVVRERWRETADAAASLEAPPGLARHLDRLRRATAETGAGLADLAAIGAAGAAAAAAASAHLKTAYGLLQGASDIRYGLTMVDFRQACCTCAAPAADRGAS